MSQIISGATRLCYDAAIRERAIGFAELRMERRVIRWFDTNIKPEPVRR